MIKKPRILHVDDDRDFLDFFGIMFRDCFDILSVDNPENAFRILKENEIDAIITDYEMPGMNGLEFLKFIRDKNHSIPVIFKTGQGNEEIAREAFILGASDYFTKEISTFAYREKFINSVKSAIEKKLWEKEKRKAEAQLHLQSLVLDQIQDRVTVTDLDGVITYVNEAEVVSLGYSRSELIGSSVEMFGENPGSGATQREIVEKTLSNGNWRGEIVNYTIDKQEVIMDCRTQVIHDETGKVFALCGISTDITKRKQAEKRIRHLNNVLSALSDVNQLITREKNPLKLIEKVCKILVEKRGFHSAWIALTDRTGNIMTSVNSGYGEDYLHFFEEMKRDELPACIRKANKSAEKITIIDPVEDFKDCQLMSIFKDREAMTAKLEHEGRLFGFITLSLPISREIDTEEQLLFKEVVEDISFALYGIEQEEKRKSAEEALRNSERDLKEAQKLACLGNWKWDIKTGNVEWSEEVYRIFRLDPGEFTPHIDSILEFSPWPEDHNRDKELIQRAIDGHEKGTYEQKFLRPDNSTGYYRSTFQGRYNEKGELISIFGTILDITDQKKSDDKLWQSNEKPRNSCNNQVTTTKISIGSNNE